MPLPTKTAILFFGKDPQRFVPQSEVKMARFSGRDVGEFIDETRLHATIPEMIESAEKFIRRNVRKSMAISGEGFKREDSPEYPYAALREAIVNAIAHRDYSITGATVRIMIFDDRIEIDNPGAAIGGMDVKDLEGKHITRNNNICRLLYELGGMEEYGTGMRRMRKLMKESGLKEPVFEEGVGFFRVTFYGPKNQDQLEK